MLKQVAASPDLQLPKFFIHAWGTIATAGSVMQPALVNALPTLTPFERLALLQRYSICCSPAHGGEPPLGGALLTALQLLRSIAIAMGTDSSRDMQVASQLPAMKAASLAAVEESFAASPQGDALEKAHAKAVEALKRL